MTCDERHCGEPLRRTYTTVGWCAAIAGLRADVHLRVSHKPSRVDPFTSHSASGAIQRNLWFRCFARAEYPGRPSYILIRYTERVLQDDILPAFADIYVARPVRRCRWYWAQFPRTDLRDKNVGHALCSLVRARTIVGLAAAQNHVHSGRLHHRKNIFPHFPIANYERDRDNRYPCLGGEESDWRLAEVALQCPATPRSLSCPSRVQHAWQPFRIPSCAE